ncbi:MAG: hypothetical protein K8R77_08475 [Anaerolineaceae bacterium]|nr:hypothetical protein [Anaerolineaceae bacterium]
MNLSLHMKKNAKKKYRYVGTHWGDSVPREEMTGEELWKYLNNHKEHNAKLRSDPWNGHLTLDPRTNSFTLEEKGFYFQRTGEILHLRPVDSESMEYHKEVILEQSYPLTKAQIIQLAKVTANAYFAIYDDGAYYPQVYFSLSSGEFGWTPSTDPVVDEDKTLIARLEQQCFGSYIGVLEYEDWNMYTEHLLGKWLADHRYYYVADAEDKIIGYERNSYTPEEIAVFAEKSAAAMRKWCADGVFPHAFQLNKKWHIPIEEGQKLACFLHWRRFLNKKINDQIFSIGPDIYR